MYLLFTPRFVAHTFLTGLGTGILAVLLALSPAHAQTSMRPAYGNAASGIVVAAAATDISCMTGAALHSIRIHSVEVSGIATTAITPRVSIIRRTAANTGGTATASASVGYSASMAATAATVANYTANPTALGAGVDIADTYVSIGVTASLGFPYKFDLTNGGTVQPVTLAAATDLLCVSLNGGTIVGGSLDVNYQFTD